MECFSCSTLIFLILPGMEPQPNWPQRGQISIDSISVRYATDLEPVLQEVSVNIRAGEKVSSVRWRWSLQLPFLLKIIQVLVLQYRCTLPHCFFHVFYANVRSRLKTNVRDKWVYITETNDSTPDPWLMLYRRMQTEPIQQASAQFEHLNGRLGPALDPMPGSLAREPALFAFSKTALWQELGESALKC